MLIITRKTLQNTIIGDDIVIKILGVKGNQVRLGIEAPREIDVHREEIYKKIQAERVEKLLDDADELDAIDRRLRNSIYHQYKQSANDSTLPKETINY